MLWHLPCCCLQAANPRRPGGREMKMTRVMVAGLAFLFLGTSALGAGMKKLATVEKKGWATESAPGAGVSVRAPLGQKLSYRQGPPLRPRAYPKSNFRTNAK